MKRAPVLFAGALATLLLGGPAIAKGPSDATTQSTTAPAPEPSKLALPHHLTGDVVSVDKKTNTLTVRDSKGKDFTLVADRDTAPDLTRLKAGDHVKLTYKKSQGQMVVTKINDTAMARTTRSK
jgi:hypothetical protein